MFIFKVNSSDDGGVLVGNWSETYAGGKSPMAWSGSVAILREYMKTKLPVKFGQCFVFSGIVTTSEHFQPGIIILLFIEMVNYLLNAIILIVSFVYYCKTLRLRCESFQLIIIIKKYIFNCMEWSVYAVRCDI